MIGIQRELEISDLKVRYEAKTLYLTDSELIELLFDMLEDLDVYYKKQCELLELRYNELKTELDNMCDCCDEKDTITVLNEENVKYRELINEMDSLIDKLNDLKMKGREI